MVRKKDGAACRGAEWVAVGEAVKLGRAIEDPVAIVLSSKSAIAMKIGESRDGPDGDDPDYAKLAEACLIADCKAETSRAIDHLIRDRAVAKFLRRLGDHSIRNIADALEDHAATLIASPAWPTASCSEWSTASTNSRAP